MENEASLENKAEQILVFSLADEELGLDISCVREVLKLGDIHPLVQAPDFVEGVIEIRNHIIAVMDLRKKFNLDPAKDKTKNRIIVCKLRGFVVGLIVDSVSEVLRIALNDIQPTPGIISLQAKNNCFSGIAHANERVIAILDLEKILTNEEIANLPLLKK